MIPTQQCSQHPGSTGAIATRGSLPAPVPPQGAPAHPVPSPGRREQVRVPPHPGPPRPVTRHPSPVRGEGSSAEGRAQTEREAAGYRARGVEGSARSRHSPAAGGPLFSSEDSIPADSQPASSRTSGATLFIRNHQNSE